MINNGNMYLLVCLFFCLFRHDGVDDDAKCTDESGYNAEHAHGEACTTTTTNPQRRSKLQLIKHFVIDIFINYNLQLKYNLQRPGLSILTY